MRQRQWTVIKTTLVVLFALDMAFGSGPLLLPWAGVVPLLAAVLLRDLLVGRAALKAAVSGLVCAGLAALILASEDLGPSRVLFVAAVGIIGAVIPLQRRREAALLEEVNRLADEAQQGRQLLEAILDHSPVVIAAVSKDPLEWVFGRDRFRELSGLDDTCCPPGQELSRLHPFDQGFLDGGGAVGRSDQRSLFRIRDCTDRYRWIECRWLPQVPVPVFGGYVLSFRDVSAEIEAGTAGELLDDFEAATSDAVLHIDLTGRVVSANARFFEVTGLTADEVIGSERLGLVIPDHRGELVRLFNTARAGERAVGSIGVLAVGAGRMPVLATMTPRRAGGEIVGVFAVFTDVSALLRAHDELAEARRQADAALAQRDALLADISHELRTPLTPIMAYSELLIDKAGDRAVVEHAGAEIFTATHKLRNLLDSLLELAELNDKSPTVTVEVAALRAVAEEAIRVAGGTLPDEIRAGVNVEITGDDLSVWADTERLVQAVAGLLRNAITHGAPPVQIHLNSDGHDGLLTVSDHGPGIPAAERERIFTPFVRLNLNHPGQGLGLAMVRRLVHSMDGDVRATDPCEGPGAAFTIRLRRARHGATAVSGIGTTGPAAPQGERPVN